MMMMFRITIIRSGDTSSRRSARPLHAFPSFTSGVGHPSSLKIWSVFFDSDVRQETGRRGATWCKTSRISSPYESTWYLDWSSLNIFPFYSFIVLSSSTFLPLCLHYFLSICAFLCFFLSPPCQACTMLSSSLRLVLAVSCSASPFLSPLSSPPPLCIWVDDWTSSCGAC